MTLTVQRFERVVRERDALRREVEQLRAAVADQQQAVGLGPFEQLTAGERAAVEAVSRGETNEQAAAALRLSLNTVKTQLSAAQAKVGVSSRTALVAAALRCGAIR